MDLQHVRANFDTILVSYSGGRDSTAALLWCIETLARKTIVAWTADTGIEPTESRSYVDQVSQLTGVPSVWCQDPVTHQDGQQVRDVFDVSRRRGKFPFPYRCEWKSTLKRHRSRLWLRATGLQRPLWVFGQRWDESATRAKLPYLSDGPETRKHGAPIFRPILDWNISQVKEQLAAHGIPEHPSYERGKDRIGCIGCVGATIARITLDVQLYPDIIAALCCLEIELQHDWQRHFPLWRFRFPDIWEREKDTWKAHRREGRYFCPPTLPDRPPGAAAGTR